MGAKTKYEDIDYYINEIKARAPSHAESVEVNAVSVAARLDKLEAVVLENRQAIEQINGDIQQIMSSTESALAALVQHTQVAMEGARLAGGGARFKTGDANCVAGE